MAEQKLNLIFGTPVILTDLGVPDWNSALEELVLKRRKEHPGSNHSNRGGWQSDMNLLSWGGEPARQLALEVLDVADAQSLDLIGTPDTPHNWILEAWGNVNGAGDSNVPHAHFGSSGCFWSAVYYVKVPEGEGGELVLEDPRGPMLHIHAPKMRFRNGGVQGKAKIQPYAGLLVMFPSWMIHSVAPWEGTEYRISVALNVIAERKLRGNPARAEQLRAGVSP